MELADELDLQIEQKLAIEASFNAMNEKARELGIALVDAEAALDAAFEDKTVTPEVLAERLALTEQIRAALRGVHLSAHLEVTPVLSDEQKAQYAQLRGYGSGGHGHNGH